ncbi:uncharacterized protein LOC122014031 [Zingiber officinale]|uniref:uncharacterized protein LOC122014031 n=1 Tax=Zingiber officinale TaxID=94328 RepID=UPI001C4AB492|nr:uncharacterized protein LOC122014031 [Zingiber officinale]
MASKKLKIADYAPLIDALSRRINAWPKLTLSYAGRAQLIQYVLQGVECYWMSILPLPIGVVERIYSLCRSFLWTSKHPPIAWLEMCRPKEEGGLGFRELIAWNTALLSRVLWRLHDQQDALWIRWVHHTYLQDTDIWRWRAKHTDSPLLKRLAQIRDQMVASAGSIEAAQHLLHGWFSQHTLSRRGISQAYDFFRDTGVHVPWAGTVWKKHIQPSHRFTLWLLAHRRAEETQEHLFFGCLQIRQLWDRIRDWLHMTHEMTTYRRMLRIYMRHYRGTGLLVRARHAAMAALIHYVWQARSHLRFESEVFDGDHIFRRIQTHVYRSLDISLDRILHQPP